MARRSAKPVRTPKPATATVTLTESVRVSGPLEYDASSRLLKDLKILGLVSENKRRYEMDAVRAALPFYQNRKVNCDHPTHPKDQRSVYDRLGKFVNVRVVEGEGLRGDLKFFQSHGMAKRLKEAADDPELQDCLSFSHNAEGTGHYDENGVFVVEKITRVESVDLVADGATTRSLTESKKGKQAIPQIKIADLFEALSADKRLPKETRKALLEMESCPEGEMDEPGAEMTPEDQLSAGFEAAIMAIVKGEGQAKEKAKKVAEYLKTHEKLLGGAAEEPVEEADEDEESDEGDKPTEEGKKPAKVAPGTSPLSEAKAKQLCKLAGVAEDRPLLETLTRLPEDAALAHLDYVKGLQTKAAAAKSGGARSSGPGGTVTTEQPKAWLS